MEFDVLFGWLCIAFIGIVFVAKCARSYVRAEVELQRDALLHSATQDDQKEKLLHSLNALVLIAEKNDMALSVVYCATPESAFSSQVRFKHYISVKSAHDVKSQQH